MNTKFRINILFVIVFCLFSNQDSILAQQQQEQYYQRQDYILNNENRLLNIPVHIWGEVNRPGEYLVPDGTDILELISKAGGPTIYSNLKNVILTRRPYYYSRFYNTSADSNFLYKKEFDNSRNKVIKLNLKEYLDGESEESTLILQPGDVVRVNRNIWYKWQNIIRVVSQIAIFIQAWYWFSRIN